MEPAIASMNLALQDPQQCKNDSTLLGVWLLGLYERLMCAQDSTSAFTKWDIHNQGLIELIRLRGREQFRTQDGRVLFFMIFNTMHSRVVPDQRYFDEAVIWFNEIYQHCEAAEYPVLRAYIFSYHCTLICRDIQELLENGDLDVLLQRSPSILQDVDGVENAIYPFTPEDPIAKCRIDPPLKPFDYVNGAYTGTSVLRSNYRLRLSHHVLEFVDQACRAPSCTYQQQIMFSGMRNRCLAEIQVLTKKISRFLDLISPGRLRAFAKMGSSIFLHKPNTIQRTYSTLEGSQNQRHSTIHIPV